MIKLWSKIYLFELKIKKNVLFNIIWSYFLWIFYFIFFPFFPLLRTIIYLLYYYCFSLLDLIFYYFVYLICSSFGTYFFLIYTLKFRHVYSFEQYLVKRLVIFHIKYSQFNLFCLLRFGIGKSLQFFYISNLRNYFFNFNLCDMIFANRNLII